MERYSYSTLTVCLVSCMFSSGCVLDSMDMDYSDEVSEIGIAEDEIKVDNALNLNALNLNALNLNALNLNALNLNAMNAASVATLQDPGPDGALARQAIKYLVSCALDTTQSFGFSWTDTSGVAHQETYWGLIGLAPSWVSQPLENAAQQWISACMISRVNWYGVSVLLSSRGPENVLRQVGSEELNNWTVREGGFWGNLFGSTPVAYACHDSANVAYSRSQQRDCAAGHLDSSGQVVECGIIHIVGSCNTACSNSDSTYRYYTNCGGTNRPITVFLQ